MASLLGLVYFYVVDLRNVDARMVLHSDIVSGVAESPYRYRLLVPHTLQSAAQLLKPLASARRLFLLLYGAFDVIALTASLLSMYAYCRRWLSAAPALLGCLLVAALMPLAFTDHYYQPWSLLEPAFYAGALLSLHRGRLWLAMLLVNVATLNRETGIILGLGLAILLWMLARDTAEFDRSRRFAAMFAALPIALYIAIRHALGPSSHIHSLSYFVSYNLQPFNLARAALHFTLFGGLLGVLLQRGLKSASRYERYSLWTVFLYSGSLAVFAQWHEVRPLLSVIPIVLPIASRYLWQCIAPSVSEVSQ